MTGEARFDIRIPIGTLFCLLGVVLTVYGIATKSDVQLYARSGSIVINLWWGVVMLLFGAAMLFFGTRVKQRPLHGAAGEETEIREQQRGLERE
jgi:uncharacterized membrane protein